MKTILVVEDDARIAAALGVRLRAAGYHVLTAPDGRTGLMSAVTAKPDLIITDIWMPDPIGFLTRERLHNLRRTAEEEGAAGFFEKPYDPQKLLAAVAEALSKCAVTERPGKPVPR